MTNRGDNLPQKYQLLYDFGEYQASINNFFNKLTNNSIQLFSKQIYDGKILKNCIGYESPKFKREFSKMHSFINNVEEFLHYYYLNDRRNFQNIFTQVSKLQAISVLNEEDRGIYGITNHNDTIQINPSLSGNKCLTPEERTRLYVAHELGHLVNKKWMGQVTQYLRNNNNLNPREKQLFYDGFSLLDEATTQDRAEEIANFYAHKHRPNITKYSDPRGMYGGDTYQTNFDFYGELQEPAIVFSRTLRGIGKIQSDAQAMHAISKRALSPNFSNSIIGEYQKDQQIANLQKEFQLLGKLKNASYARFGYGDRSYLASSKATFQSLRNIASQLRDYREPLDDIMI